MPLRDVADVYINPTPNEITREYSSRRIDVTCNTSGRDLGAVAGDIRKKLNALQFPAGYHPEILGEYAERQAGQNRLYGLALLSLLGIFLILYADFGSYRTAAIILSSLLFAVTGCILALLPIVVTGNQPGQEIEYPMAIVILGGLATSTILNLFFLPLLYLRFGRPAQKTNRTA